MMQIKDGVDTLDLKISQVHNSEDFRIFMDNKVNADKRRVELEKKLTKVSEQILKGLESLSCMMNAVEKLAVTSLHVFTDNTMLCLPEGINFNYIESIIIAARQICPLLLEFKRDPKVFFLPKLQNVDVLKYQLDRCIQITQKICERLQERLHDI